MPELDTPMDRAQTNLDIMIAALSMEATTYLLPKEHEQYEESISAVLAAWATALQPAEA